MKNDKNKNFDNYVKKILTKDPVVPSGMDWDMMDIEIPRNRNRRKPIYFILGSILLGIVFFAGYLFRANYEKEGKDTYENSVQFVIQNESNNHDPKRDILISTEVRNDKDVNQDYLDLASAEMENSIQQESRDDVLQNEIPTENISLGIRDVFYKDQFFNDDTKNSAVGQVVKNVSKMSDHNEPKFLRDEKLDLSINKEGSINKKRSAQTVPMSRIVLAADYIREINSPALEYFESHHDDVLNQEIGLRIGSNLVALDIPNQSSVDGKLSSFLGASLNLFYYKNLSERFTLSAAVEYNEMHTVFQHNFEVERFYNFASGTQTIRHRNIYKNNFARTLGLSSGIGYRISLISDLELIANISVSASRLLTQEGLTLDEDRVVDMNDLNFDKDIEFGIMPSLDIKYSLNKKCAFRISSSYNKALLNGLDFGEGVKRSSTMQFSTGISYHF